MRISRIKTILDACERFNNREIYLFQLADVLDEPSNKIHALLLHNDIIDYNGDPLPWVNYQDVVNTILMFYAIKPYHYFIETIYGPVSTDYRRKPQKIPKPTKPFTPP